MRLAYVLIVHKNPAQVARLIERFRTPGASFYVHVDKRAPRTFDRDVLDHLGGGAEQVTFVERHLCYWAGFGVTLGTLACLRAALESSVPFDRVVLLSGQDYPIRSVDEIEAFYEQHPQAEFMECFPMNEPNRWTTHGGAFQAMERVIKVHVRIRSHFFHLPIKRRFPQGLTPFGGSQWWSLTRECVETVVRFARERPEVLRYFRNVFIPDECLFQTIVGNSPHAHRIVQDDQRFIDWEIANPTPPAVLGIEDFDRLMASDKLIARKFEPDRDSRILDALDRELDRGVITPAGPGGVRTRPVAARDGSLAGRDE